MPYTPDTLTARLVREFEKETGEKATSEEWAHLRAHAEEILADPVLAEALDPEEE